MSGYNSRINLLNQGDTVSVSPAFTPNHAPRVRIGGTGFKVWEPAKPQGSGKAKGNPGLNTLIVTDLEKLIRHRRAFGPWSLAIAEAVFNEAAPRIIAHARKAGKDANDKLQIWSAKWVPELVEAHGSDWIDERGEEIGDEKTGSFRNMDQIAQLLAITEDEVLGCLLSSLVSEERPKAVRVAENKRADAAKHKANRIAQGATPRELSKSRLKPWDAEGVSRATYYRQLADAKAAQARETDSSVTVLTYKVSDETVSQTDLARNSISVEAVQAVAEPLIFMSEDRIRERIKSLQAVAHIAQADFVREVPFYANESWF